MDFQLIRVGAIDGVCTQQDITNHPQKHEWSDESIWKPLTPHFIVPMILKCVTTDSDGDSSTYYFVARYTFGKWQDINTGKNINTEHYNSVHWKLV